MANCARRLLPALVPLITIAAGCISAADTRLRESAEQAVTRSMRAADADERLRATRIAAQVADPNLDRALPEQLGDSDLRVRAAAGVALAGQSPIAAQLLGQILDGGDAPARLIAFEGHRTLADSLGLLRKLVSDPEPSLRARVAAELGSWKPSGAGAGLFSEGALKQLAADPDPAVRAAAVRSCGGLAGRALLATVEGALTDRALGVRLAALWALGRLDASPERFTLLASSQDRFVTLRAAVQLRRLGREAQAIEVVRAALADPRPEVRAAAMNAAGELGAASVELAESVLRDPDLEVRLAAARVLAHHDRADQALRVLRAALDGPLELEAADELSRLGDAEGRAHLNSAFASADPWRRRVALELLAPLPGATGVLERALADLDPQVRLSAAESVLRRFYR